MRGVPRRGGGSPNAGRIRRSADGESSTYCILPPGLRPSPPRKRGGREYSAYANIAFTVCYLNEAREGDRVTLRHGLADGILQVDATRPDPADGSKSHRVFAVKAMFA